MKRVLIVEDDSSILQLFSNGIGGEFEVQGVTDGQEALEKVGEGVDLVLLDLASSVSPACFLKSLRGRDKHTPVIAIVGIDNQETLSQLKEFDIEAHVGRPLSIEKLMEVVRKSCVMKEDLDFLTSAEIGGGITTFFERQRAVQKQLKTDPKYQRPMQA